MPFLSQPKILEQYLNIEDSRLLMHLKACAAMSKLPYDLWFKKCFAGCLPESSLQRQDFFFLSICNSTVILNCCYHMHFTCCVVMELASLLT